MKSNDRAADQKFARARAVVVLICRRMDIDIGELSSAPRTPRLMAARRFTSAMARKHTGASYPQIAVAIGKHNRHSSVMASERRFYEILRDEPDQLVLGRTFKSWADQFDREVAAMLANWQSQAA